MSMLALAFDVREGAADLVMRDGALVSDDDQALTTAVLLSLHTDRRVEASEVPAGVDRGGWWGDAYRRIDDDVEGSRLWLLKGAAATTETLRRAEQYAEEALAWLVEDNVADVVAATAEYVRPDLLGLVIVADGVVIATSEVTL
jgi:phage gp46-like protein